MGKKRRISDLWRLVLPVISIALTLFLSGAPVMADANYRIKLSTAVENAVFSLTYTGDVQSLAIVSPDGVTYDSSSCGSAYRKDEGKIRIGLLYAGAGSWQIIIAGSPDDGFRLLITSDPGYGEYAGTRPAGQQETVPPETAAPSSSSAPGTESAAISSAPGQSGSTSGPEVIGTEANSRAAETVMNSAEEEEVPAGDAASVPYGDETVSGMMESQEDGANPPVYAGISNPTETSVSEWELLSGTQADASTSVAEAGTASVYREAVVTSAEAPTMARQREGSGDASGVLMFMASAATLSAIVIAVGKIIREARSRTSPERANSKNRTEKSLDFRVYFPEEK